MSPEIIGAIGLLCMIAMVMLRVPVALAMLGVGLVGFGAVTAPIGAVQMLKDLPVDVLAKYDFSAIPLFILMGVFASHSGMAGKFNAVIFSPVDLSLVADGPAVRRRFLDTAIGQIYILD